MVLERGELTREALAQVVDKVTSGGTFQTSLSDLRWDGLSRYAAERSKGETIAVSRREHKEISPGDPSRTGEAWSTSLVQRVLARKPSLPLACT